MERKWEELDPIERAKIIKLGLDNGVSNIQDIRDTYRIYAEGGSTREWDNTLPGKLIIASENPDSVGYENGRWYAPTKKGFDPNQFGMGVDRNQTPGFAERVKKDKEGREYLTEVDERALRYAAIEAANNSANKRYEYAKTAVKHTNSNISRAKDAAVVSAIYNLGAGYVANTLFEDSTFMKNLFDGTDKEVIERINKEYKKKGRYERIANQNAFFKLATGGPLYPFSFSKYPLPVVRY